MKSQKTDHQWIRVFGPNLQPEHAARGKKNEKVLRSGKFIKACESADIKPTRRQASKYRRGFGIAFFHRDTSIGIS